MVLAVITMYYFTQSFITLQVCQKSKSTNVHPIHDTSYDGIHRIYNTSRINTLLLAGAIWSILQSLFTTFY